MGLFDSAYKTMDLEYPFNLVKEFDACVNYFKGWRKKEIYKISTNYINNETISFVLGILTDRQRQAILLRFRDKKSFVDIGKDMSVTTERVRQLCRRGILSILYSPEYKVFEIGLDEYKKQVNKEKRIMESLLINTGELNKPLIIKLREVDIVTTDDLINISYTKLHKIMCSIGLSQRMKAKLILLKVRLSGGYKGEVERQRTNNIKINDLDFSTKTLNCLQRKGIEYLNDLLEMDINDISKIRGIGVKSLNEILMFIVNYGREEGQYE